MTNTKWLRRALLGGVALSVMATGAQASELSELKAQLEALQSRVNTLEAAPAPAALPEGYSYLSAGRGSGSNSDWGNEAQLDRINNSDTRGYTISVTPTADLPAPVAEVTVYGYVKGDVRYSDDDRDFQPSISPRSWNSSYDSSEDHIVIQATQSRFGIKSKVDTAIGQIRTRIEGDFEGGFSSDLGRFRLRHAYGMWDMTENMTLVIGQYWRVASLLPLGISTVDFAGTGAWTYSRDPQVSITYASGPFTLRFGIQRPNFTTEANLPDIGGSIQYDMPGGHTVVASAQVGFNDSDSTPAGTGDKTSWVVQAGANINLADVATLTGAVVYGKGRAARDYMLSPIADFNNGGTPTERIGFMAGVSVPVSDTTTFNVVWDYQNDLDNSRGTTVDKLHIVHANVMWQPVKQMRMGWEVIWYNGDDNTGPASAGVKGAADGVSAQFGTWFFF